MVAWYAKNTLTALGEKIKFCFARGVCWSVLPYHATMPRDFRTELLKKGRVLRCLDGSLVVTSYISPTVPRYSGFILARMFYKLLHGIEFEYHEKLQATKLPCVFSRNFRGNL